MSRPCPLPPAAAPGRPAPRASGISWVGGVALALVLYVLSTGPVAVLIECKGYFPMLKQPAVVIYSPIKWAVEADPTGTVEQGLWWYLKLWGYELNFGGTK